jgi:hypothetical protein
MAVFTSGGISSDNIRLLVSSDVIFTHPNKIVHDAVFCYQSAIHYLLQHTDQNNRAELAFTKVLKEAETYHSNSVETEGLDCKLDSYKIIDWLKLAIVLNALTISKGGLLLDSFPVDILNIRENEGCIQRPFVLSFYYLLRYEHY